MTSTPDASSVSDEDRTALADTVTRFARTEIAPHVDAWDAAGEFPRSLYRRAADLGLLGLGYPEQYGGTPASYQLRLPLWRALSRHGASGGVLASLPPVLAHGSDAVRAEVIPPVLAGEQIAALAITEPGGGSDVAQLKTTARREGDEYIVNGEKVFITSGMRADYFTVAVKTAENQISLILVDGQTPGITRTPLKKMGWWASDTAEIGFMDCKVPVSNLIGAEGEGGKMLMHNFNQERLALSAASCGYAQVCLFDAVEWAKSRYTFNRPLSDRQVIRHKIVDMVSSIESTRSMIDNLALRIDSGESPSAQIAMLKNLATRTFQMCADHAVQILGGAGYMRGTRAERLYREVKVMMIGGGAEEIMKDLAANRLGL